MKLLTWIRSLRPSKTVPITSSGLHCANCGCKIHRYDRYTIVAAKHRDCKDKKLVGQGSIPARGDV